MIHHFIESFLPEIVGILELMGIFIVCVGAVKAFYHYLKGIFKGENSKIKYELAAALATGLEFKMAAEILKTLLIKNFDELLILGSVILLRALLSFIIHIEIKADKEQQA